MNTARKVTAKSMSQAQPILAHDGDNHFTLPASEAWPRLQALHHHALLEASRPDMGASSRPMQTRYAKSLGSALGQFATSHPELRNSMFESLVHHVGQVGSMDGLASMYASGLTDAQRRQTHLYERASHTLKNVGWPNVVDGGLEHGEHLRPEQRTQRLPRQAPSDVGAHLESKPRVAVGGASYFLGEGGLTPAPGPSKDLGAFGDLDGGNLFTGLPGGQDGLPDFYSAYVQLHGLGGIPKPGDDGGGGDNGGGGGGNPFAHFTGCPWISHHLPGGKGPDPGGGEGTLPPDTLETSCTYNGGSCGSSGGGGGGGGGDNEVGRPSGSTASGGTGTTTTTSSTDRNSGTKTTVTTTTSSGGGHTTITTTDTGLATRSGPIKSGMDGVKEDFATAAAAATGTDRELAKEGKAPLSTTERWILIYNLYRQLQASRAAGYPQFFRGFIMPADDGTGGGGSGSGGPKSFAYMPSDEGNSPAGPKARGARSDMDAISENGPSAKLFEVMPAPDDPGSGGPRSLSARSFDDFVMPNPESNSPGTPHS